MKAFPIRTLPESLENVLLFRIIRGRQDPSTSQTGHGKNLGFSASYHMCIDGTVLPMTRQNHTKNTD